jgi:hypothetical protein
MATTTNYGWTTPDDTALVKDGAAAIRTLGSSVDTTTKNLNPETTLGDLAYRSSTANVKTRLALGTAGQVLQVNSGANAPEWATFAAGGMTLINTGGTTLSGASVTIGSIPATYKHLQIVINEFKPATDDVNIRLRINGDSNANRYNSSQPASINNESFNNTLVQLSQNNDNSVASNLIVVDIPNYANANIWKMMMCRAITVNPTTTTNFNFNFWFNFYNQLTAISSLEFLTSSGNFTSGTVYVYGVS